MTVGKAKLNWGPSKDREESNGGVMARPDNPLVELPAVLANIIELLNTPSVTGLNETSRFVSPEESRVNGLPEMMTKLPEAIEPVPESPAPPALLTIKLAWRLPPSRTTPKSRLSGETTS